MWSAARSAIVLGLPVRWKRQCRPGCTSLKEIRSTVYGTMLRIYFCYPFFSPIALDLELLDAKNRFRASLRSSLSGVDFFSALFQSKVMPDWNLQAKNHGFARGIQDLIESLYRKMYRKSKFPFEKPWIFDRWLQQVITFDWKTSEKKMTPLRHDRRVVGNRFFASRSSKSDGIDEKNG